MNKFLLKASAIGLGFGLVACATMENQKNAVTAKNDLDRKVAQTATVENTTDLRKFEPVCGHAPNAEVRMDPTQVVLTSRQEAVVRYTVRTPIYACEETEGDGTGGDWHGFYDRSGNKAKMLNDAIKGVGEKTAPHLVAPFMAGKPRSWRKFSDVITNAAQKMKAENGIDPSWTNGVLVQYKQENMVNLGYVASTGCEITGYKDETYEIRTPMGESSVVVETKVLGGKLLPSECETYSVSWNGHEVSAGVSSTNNSSTSDYNKYKLQVNYDEVTKDRNNNGRKVLVTLTGSRIQTNPPYFVEYKGSTISSSNGTAQLTLRNSRYHEAMRFSEFAAACKLSATAIFYGKTGSFWNAKSGAALKTVTVALDGNADSTTVTADGVTLKDKERAAATVTTAFASGCPFYNTKVLEVGKFD